MNRIVRKLLNSVTARNAVWLIGSKIIQMAINLLVGILTARYLGPSNYGLISYGMAYTSFFSSLCTLGINSVIVKELIDYPDDEGTILGSSIGMRAISSFLSVITILCIVSIIDRNEPDTILVVFLCSIGVLFNVLDIFVYWFQSKLLSKYTAIATLVAYITTAAYRVYLMISGGSVVFFAVATSIDYFVLGSVLAFFYWKKHGKKLSFSVECSKRILSKSCHFILPGLMVAIYGQTDKLMLKQMISSSEIGYYTTAVSVCSMWCFVLNAIIDSFYPSIMSAHKENNIGKYRARNIQLYSIVFWLSMSVSALIAIFAPIIISILYGKEFLPAAAPLRIITWYTAFSYLGVARNAWVVCENKQKYLIWIYLSSAIMNVLLNVFFIPLFGASGAAIASLVAQVLTVMVVPLFIKPLRENTIMMIEAVKIKR